MNCVSHLSSSRNERSTEWRVLNSLACIPLVEARDIVDDAMWCETEKFLDAIQHKQSVMAFL